jgi:nucleotide-binding universal stress UspA family protein
MTRVLVAVDDSEASIHAARTAHHLFGDRAEYLAINVADPNMGAGGAVASWGPIWGVGYPTPWGAVFPYEGGAAQGAPVGTPGGQPAGSDEITPVDAASGQAHQAAERAGLPRAEALGDAGDPVSAILDAANQHHVDVIVVGHRERGWLDRLFSSSVSGDVTKRAEVPVLVVK